MNDRVVHLKTLEAGFGDAHDVGMAPTSMAVSPFQKIHQSLRGRYFWAILLAVLGGAGGAYAGYRVPVPVYRGTGIIYLQPSMPSSEDMDGLHVLPMFEGFMAFQVDMLEGPRAAHEAMRTETWKQTGQASGDEAIAGFLRRLHVVRKGGTQHIRIQFDDPDPQVAIAGVRALIEAYIEVSKKINDTDQNLLDVRAQGELLAEQIRKRNLKIISLTSEYGGMRAMELRYEVTQKALLISEQEAKRVQNAIRAYVASGVQEVAPKPLSRGQIAIENSQMAVALRDLRNLQADEELLLKKVPETSDQIVGLRKKISVLNAFIDEFVGNYNSRRVDEWKRETGLRSVRGLSLEDLKKAAKNHAADADGYRAQSRKIGQLLTQVEELKEDDALDDRLRSNAERLQKRLERQLIGKGRVKKADMGFLPTTPFKDRRLSMAALGGFMAGSMGLLIVMLLGMRDRRLKSAADVDQTKQQGLANVKMLGLLPRLPSLTDVQGCEVAAHCAHQVRMMLQIGYARERGSCICVTGPGVGSGKTTVAAALGLSFASSGSRTLLIDADLSGRGLTRRVRQMLLGHLRAVALGDERDAEQSGHDTAGRLLRPLVPARDDAASPKPEELLSLLSRSVERLGARAARESGVLEEILSLADLLSSGRRSDEFTARLADIFDLEEASGEESKSIPPQVMELGAAGFNGVPMDRYLYRTGTDNMHFLPLRGLGRGGTVSGATLSNVLSHVRDDFDVVLIDTGPARGAVETSLVAAYADAVVFVVSSEDQRPVAEQAVAHLQGIGATMAGVVFNRAGRKDVVKVSGSMSRSVEVD